jgi:hypothetical protein
LVEISTAAPRHDGSDSAIVVCLMVTIIGGIAEFSAR